MHRGAIVLGVKIDMTKYENGSMIRSHRLSRGKIISDKERKDPNVPHDTVR